MQISQKYIPHKKLFYMIFRLIVVIRKLSFNYQCQEVGKVMLDPLGIGQKLSVSHQVDLENTPHLYLYL